MSQGVIVLSRDQQLLDQLSRHFNGHRPLIHCESIDALRDSLEETPVCAVLVHFDRTTLNGHTAGEFMSELEAAADRSRLVGLLDESCPERLAKLAHHSIGDLLPLPFDVSRLDSLISESRNLEQELEGFWSGMPHKELHGRSRSLVTFTPEMFGMIDDLRIAARHNVTILLTGETGSGKTFLARLIHEISENRDERLCTVACGALPPNLIESELFGYAKGAFTGADRDREGKFSAAGKGTLLLDEIDVLPPEQQAKLLRVIETGEYEPVGDNETRTSQARLIVASNYHLEDLVQAGVFRTDLFYRLNILSFRLLPLRERPWDIEYLARKFALEHSRTHKIQLRAIEPAFLEAMRHYQWPGNVREMENVIRRAVLYCRRGVLALSDLPSSIRAAVGSAEGAWAPAAATAHAPQVPHAARSGATLPGFANGRGPAPGFFAGGLRPTTGALYPRDMRESGHPHSDPNGGALVASGVNGHSHPPMQSAGRSGDEPKTLEARVDLLECRIIEDTLRRNNHRRKETAAELGISRVTLYNKMKKFGLL